MPFRFALWVFLLLGLLGCAATGHILDKLNAVLPPEAGVEMGDTCSGKVFPHAASFTVAPQLNPADVLTQKINGQWSRAASFQEFIAQGNDLESGPGIGATLLDGRSCLRDFSDRADEILYGESPGLYYRSENRKIVIVLFDEPAGTGVIFLQGR